MSDRANGMLEESRIGSFAARVAGRRTKWIVIGFWVLLLLASVPFQSLLEERSTNSSINFLPATADSTKVAELLGDGTTFDAGEQVPSIIVFQTSGGKRAISARDVSRIEAWTALLEQDAGRLPADATVTSPFTRGGPPAAALRSEDGSTLLVVVNLKAPSTEQIKQVVDDLRSRAGDVRSDDLDVYVTGPAGFAADAGAAFSGIDGKLILGTSLLVLLLLLGIYRSPLIALVPLIAVIIAASLARAVLGSVIDPFDFVVSGQTSGIMLILVFGAGTDYCLLIVARFREELQRFADPHDAMRETVRHTTPAILSSAGTVILAMLVLLLAELRSTSSLGPALIIGVTISMLAGLSLLPALLLALGRRSFWPFIPRYDAAPASDRAVATRTGGWWRLARSVSRRPVAWLVPVLVLLLVMAGGFFTQDNHPTSDLDLFLDTPQSIAGIDAIKGKLPAGELAQGTVLLRANEAATLEEVTRTVLGVLEQSSAIGSAFPSTTGSNDDGEWQQITFSMAASPYAQKSVNAIDPLRTKLRNSIAGTKDTTVLVGGPTAETRDTQASNSRDLRIIVPGVLLMIALVLMILLRALVTPLFLVATVVLGYIATLGICFVLMLGVLGQPGIDPGTLTFIFLFTAALGIDYNIFLVARIREEALRSGSTVEATRDALATTGGVITSAGAILAGTFLILASLPLLPLRQLGIAVAIGVLLDTVLVRALVVPAVLTLLGERSWWPARRDHV